MECSGPPPQADERQEPAGDDELIARLRAAVRRHRQINGPPRAEFLVDGMRVVLENQHLGWPWPTREPE